MERIEAGVYMEQALEILYWVASVQEPFTYEMLLHATSVRPGDTDFDEEGVILEDVTFICAGLVEIDQATKIVRLAHYTTLDYLHSVQQQRFPHLSSVITSRCLTYLSFQPLKRPLQEPFARVLERYPLLDYAARFWGSTMKQISDEDGETRSQALTFLREPYRLSDLIIKTILRVEAAYGMEIPGSLTGLHLAVYFDLGGFLPDLLNHGQHSLPEIDISPLELAAKLGRYNILQKLIEAGADLHKSTGFPWGPLHQAAVSGHMDIVRLLLDAGADPNGRVLVMKDSSRGIDTRGGHTVLHEAVWNGHSNVVELLLDRGADPNIKYIGGSTPPIINALFNGVNSCFEVLVRRGAELRDKTLMFLLVQSCPSTLLRDLIDRGLDLNQPCEHEKSALDFALEVGKADIVELLVQHGARARLPWRFSDPLIARYTTEPWFPLLEAAALQKGDSLNKTEDEQQGPGGYLCRIRGKPIGVIRHDSPEQHTPYVEAPITDALTQPISKIIFTTMSHDQGWSDLQGLHGTYLRSTSWFEADVGNRDNSPNEQESTRKHLQYNVHASREWKQHVNVWDRRTCSEGTRAWMDLLTCGTTVQVYARAHYMGWVNFVGSVKIEVYGSSGEGDQRLGDAAG